VSSKTIDLDDVRGLSAEGDLRSFMASSFGLHILLVAAAFVLGRPNAFNKPQDSYRIDFVKSTSGVRVAPVPEALKPKQPKISKAMRMAAQDPDDAFRHRKHGALRPSVLEEPEPEKPPEPEPAKVAEAEPEMPAGADVSADFPNFPYPWYITQIRAALWSQWTRRMPRQGTLGCVVRFEIDRSGQPTVVEVEQASGNSLYDYAAISAVRGAAPFPPLPDEFRESALRVHVQFKTTPQ
jgi:protein TonB